MKTFNVNYYFSGHGCAIIVANTEEEVEQKFIDGNWEEVGNEEEWTDSEIIDITEI